MQKVRREDRVDLEDKTTKRQSQIDDIAEKKQTERDVQKKNSGERLLKPSKGETGNIDC
jgi:hypothetical protein